MVTFILNAENQSQDLKRELLGYILTKGLNFRYVPTNQGNTLFVETCKKYEAVGFRRLLNSLNIKELYKLGKKDKLTKTILGSRIFTYNDNKYCIELNGVVQ